MIEESAQQHALSNRGHRAYMTPAGWACLDCDEGTHPMVPYFKKHRPAASAKEASD